MTSATFISPVISCMSATPSLIFYSCCRLDRSCGSRRPSPTHSLRNLSGGINCDSRRHRLRLSVSLRSRVGWQCFETSRVWVPVVPSYTTSRGILWQVPRCHGRVLQTKRRHRDCIYRSVTWTSSTVRRDRVTVGAPGSVALRSNFLQQCAHAFSDCGTFLVTQPVDVDDVSTTA
jgi:hypothetical protein